MKLALVLLSFFTVLAACSNQPCKIEERTDVKITGDEKVSSAKKDLTNRIFIYKPDGSLQCGMGNKTDVNDMKKELSKIEVFSAENKHDGMMRIQVCGAPTGFSNVYEIDKKNLDEVLKLGFKKWNNE
jgi:hypothetical protein